jgi:hypothetical protein
MELVGNSNIQANKLIQYISKLKIHQKYLSKAFVLIMEHICNNSKGGLELCKNTNVNSLSGETKIMLGKTNSSNSQMENFRRVDPDILSILDRISTDNIRHDLTNLSGFYTSHSKSPLLNDAGNLIMNQLNVIGYKDIFHHSNEATINNKEFLSSSNVISP